MAPSHPLTVAQNTPLEWVAGDMARASLIILHHRFWRVHFAVASTRKERKGAKDPLLTIGEVRKSAI